MIEEELYELVEKIDNKHKLVSTVKEIGFKRSDVSFGYPAPIISLINTEKEIFILITSNDDKPYKFYCIDNKSCLHELRIETYGFEWFNTRIEDR